MSDEVSDFLRSVELLKERREEEDEARSRELEEKILQEKKERQARRAGTPPPPPPPAQNAQNMDRSEVAPRTTTSWHRVQGNPRHYGQLCLPRAPLYWSLCTACLTGNAWDGSC